MVSGDPKADETTPPLRLSSSAAKVRDPFPVPVLAAIVPKLITVPPTDSVAAYPLDGNKLVSSIEPVLVNPLETLNVAAPTEPSSCPTWIVDPAAVVTDPVSEEAPEAMRVPLLTK